MARPQGNLPSTGSSLSGDILRQSSFEKYVPNKFRLLGLVIPFAATYYPSLVEDYESGVLRQGFKIVRHNIKCDEYGWTPQPTIIDEIIHLDSLVRNNNKPAGDTKKIQSRLAPSYQYLLPCFHRGGENPNKIILLQVGKQIYNAIKALQNQPDEDDSSKLDHGPIWTGDVIITKVDKEKKTGNEFFDIKYEVRSARGNKLAGQFSKEIYLDKNVQVLNDLYDDAVKHGIFSEEEKDAFDKYDMTSIIENFRPHTPSEVKAMLSENPIMLDATELNGTRIFPNYDQYQQELIKCDIRFQFGADKLSSAKQIESTQQAEPVKEVKTTAVEASAEIVPVKVPIKTSSLPVEEKKPEGEAKPDESAVPDFMKRLNSKE